MTRVDETVFAIKDMIQNKHYDANGFLPSEGELSEKLGVSRITVREAVRALEVRGFLSRLHGKGIKVCENSNGVMVQTITDMFEKKDLSIEEVLEVRKIIEPQAAELAALRITSQELKELSALVKNMENATVINDEYLKSDLKFHQKLAYSAKNNMLSAIVCAYSGLLLKSIESTSKTKINLENTYHYHRDIYNAVKKANPQKAKKCMEKHLEASYKNKED